MLGKGPKWDATRVNIGPLLFIIFINDLLYICGENMILCLADDAKMYCHINDLARTNDKEELKNSSHGQVNE